MKKNNVFLILLLAVMFAACSQSDIPVVPPTPPSGTTINYHLATADEARTLMQGNTEHYAKMSQLDIDWRLEKTGGTLSELQAMAWQQTRDFTESEKQFFATAIGIVEDSLRQIGCSLPIPPEIVFIKTTMEEEGGPAAYTIKNQIFFGEKYISKLMPQVGKSDEENQAALMKFTEVVAHELFHTTTRNSPAFRQQMYDLIGFTVMPKDIVFPEVIANRIIINPDVEHMDNYGEFTIGGKKTRCEIVAFYTKTWAEAHAERGGDVSFFDFVKTFLVPIDDMSRTYPIEDASDFWDVVGRNTDYVIAPEECLADNFAFAVVRGMHPAKPYKTPALIGNIITLLKQYK
ncbi:MAG: hypothetical protein II886_10160 [Prevotella sp.]|nr:hypothetical protein [Prevotella sp.]